MKLGMTYKDIIKHSPKGGEAMMWDAVERVDDLVAKLRKENPEMARDFLKGNYEAMNGRHINEWLAKEMVAKMWHEVTETTREGKVKKKVSGELITPEGAMTLIDDMVDNDLEEKCKWDAYVAANAFMHDLSNTGQSKQVIMDLAKHFWFHDDDMGDPCGKVYWYFEDWIYG
jgi:hypothetical protein